MENAKGCKTHFILCVSTKALRIFVLNLIKALLWFYFLSFKEQQERNRDERKRDREQRQKKGREGESLSSGSVVLSDYFSGLRCCQWGSLQCRALCFHNIGSMTVSERKVVMGTFQACLAEAMSIKSWQRPGQWQLFHCILISEISKQKCIHHRISEYNNMQREYCRPISLIEYRHEYSRKGISNPDHISEELPNTRPKILISSWGERWREMFEL